MLHRYNCKLNSLETSHLFARFFLDISNQVQGERQGETASASASAICNPSNSTLILTSLVFGTIKTLRESRSCHTMKIVEAMMVFIQMRILSLTEMSERFRPSCKETDGYSTTGGYGDLRGKRSSASISTLYSFFKRVDRASSSGGDMADGQAQALTHDWNCDINHHGALILILVKFEEIMFGPEGKLMSTEPGEENESPTTTASPTEGPMPPAISKPSRKYIDSSQESKPVEPNEVEIPHIVVPFAINQVKGQGLPTSQEEITKMDPIQEITPSQQLIPEDDVEWHRTTPTPTEQPEQSIEAQTSPNDAPQFTTSTSRSVGREKNYSQHHPSRLQENTKSQITQLTEPIRNGVQEHGVGPEDVNNDEKIQARRTKKKKTLKSRLNRNRLDNQNENERKDSYSHEKGILKDNFDRKEPKVNPKLQKSRNGKPKVPVTETEVEDGGDDVFIHRTKYLKDHHSTHQEQEKAVDQHGGLILYDRNSSRTHDDFGMGDHTDVLLRPRRRQTRLRRATIDDISETLLHATAAACIADFHRYVHTILAENCEEIQTLIRDLLSSVITTNEDGTLKKMEAEGEIPMIFGDALRSGCVIPDDYEQSKVELAKNLEDAYKFVKKQQEICRDS